MVRQLWSELMVGDKNLLAVQGIEPPFLGGSARRLVTVAADLSCGNLPEFLLVLSSLHTNGKYIPKREQILCEF